MSSLEKFRRHLKSGNVYQRSDLKRWSRSADRYLKVLIKEGLLVKLFRGVYFYPENTVFGKTVPKDQQLVSAFLKDDNFLLISKNLYNGLGVGTTQLYNEQIVYNQKHSGKFKLGKRIFHFKVLPRFPKKINPEFLLVDLVNNVDSLAEDKARILSSVERKIRSMERRKLQKTAKTYANAKSKKFWNKIFGES